MNADNQSPERFLSPSPTPFRRRRPSRALLAGAALALLGATTLISGSGCSVNDLRVAAMRNPFPESDTVVLGKLHEPDALRADLDWFCQLQLATAPDLEKHARLDHVARTRDRLKASIDRPLDRRRFSALVDELAASYGVGHIYTFVPTADWNAWVAGGGRVPSYRFIDDGRVLSLRARDGVASLAESATLVSFAGVDAAELRGRLRSMVSSETEASLRDSIARSAAVDLWSMGLEAPYRIVMRDASGAMIEIDDAGVAASAHGNPFDVATSVEGGAGSSGQPSRLPWSFRWVGDASGEDIGLLTWDSMSSGTEAAWARELDRVFTELAERPARGLIVDIRANGGGNSMNGELLLASVSDRPYRLFGGKLWKRSQAYEEYMERSLSWWASLFRPLFLGDYGRLAFGEQIWINKDGPIAVNPDIRRRFDGPSALLIGPGTYSSARMTADVAKNFQMMLVVGRPTGARANELGDVGFARLPNSGLIVSFCTAYFLGASGDPDRGGPVEPDILVPDDDGGARAVEVAIKALRERHAIPR
jgi:hypothetical protein